ncbi:SSU rRNA (adenine(1518)-N(6)/adenine(1519)-N(6))-dimethyltransferase (EC [Olavius algarvensis associated proteobacterium Delta 3]|nr:SSU rRNA (adenine(1518)-N(6)/adenine(1519)-N(6))-dimethyltransferase (EC [Olavius algarvensis associated proteobacterium Delta 3]CAB5159197.1 SSU rRNA (adenine(1518)-N(6)/adenine(1519)-N(6))-dimethyltransferase (EC [Olavius algarvensis associated proteobacterium Delta 3]
MTSPKVLLTAWQLRAKKRYGQNFLRHPSTAEQLVGLVRVTPEDVVLEIGAGLGALTIPLARSARKVVAVERDPDLAGLLKTELLAAGTAEVVILQQNILDVDVSKIASSEGQPLIVVGNLPYNISSQILIRLVAERNSISRAVLMFQKELADRICAGPGGKTYGRLSVLIQYCAQIEKILQVKAADFFPKPKVDATVLRLTFLHTPEFPAGDETFFFKVVQAAFSQRRKMLKNALSGSFLKVGATLARNALADADIDPSRRAETLSVQEFVRLSDHLQSLLPRNQKDGLR